MSDMIGSKEASSHSVKLRLCDVWMRCLFFLNFIFCSHLLLFISCVYACYSILVYNNNIKIIIIVSSSRLLDYYFRSLFVLFMYNLKPYINLGSQQSDMTCMHDEIISMLLE